ncbi:MAG: glycosyl transferase, family 2, partial [Chloroflexi bacterium]|nr:glycosyl transferase, family 2 [Chloroflexota bacterium]
MEDHLADPPRAVTVVVVNWNGRERLRGCLGALALQDFQDFDVVVVDNASSDGSVELVESDYPDVRVIRNQTNTGFAAANNVAIRGATSRYVATLNNDTLPDRRWLGALVDRMEADSTVGSIASKMVFAHDANSINSCGIALDPVGIAWDLCGGLPSSVVERPRQVFGPCAGAALYRREMLDDVGLFDEDFFAYLEDVDLAWRARLRRWGCVLAPDALVVHAHAGTLGEGSPLKAFLLARNKVWSITKCAPGPLLRRWLPLIVAYDVGAAWFGVARQHDWASVRGRLAAVRGLPRMLEKRREIQGRRTATDGELRALYAPLALPWDVPRRYRHLTPLLRRAGVEIGPLPGVDSAGEVMTAPVQPVSQSAPGPRQRLRRQLLRGSARLLGIPGRDNGRVPGEPRLLVLRPDHLGDVLLSRPALQLLVDT